MKNLLAKTRAFLTQEDGATATEYAVLLALIAVVVIGVATLLGDKISAVFAGVADEIPAPGGGS